MVTDLPAPLSPVSAVTLPAGTVRFTPLSARTAPNTLLTPRNSSSGASSAMFGTPSDTASFRAAPWPTPRASRGVGLERLLFSRQYPPGLVGQRLWRDARRGACGLEGTGTQLRGRDEVVLHHRRGNVRRRDPLRRLQN